MERSRSPCERPVSTSLTAVHLDDKKSESEIEHEAFSSPVQDIAKDVASDLKQPPVTPVLHDHRPSTTDYENLLVLEIFSGSGRLTAAVRKLGIRGVAIDRTSARTSGPVTILDLTSSADLEFLLGYIANERENLLLVHLVPPCGTCSAAGNKRRKGLEDLGFDVPKPLRSPAYPMGFPYLRGLDKAKVDSANLLYRATYRIVQVCAHLGITVSVENPLNSCFGARSPSSKCWMSLAVAKAFFNIA